jgi:hypothetical protein
MDKESQSVLGGLLDMYNGSASPRSPGTGADNSAEPAQSSTTQQHRSWPSNESNFAHVDFDYNAEANYPGSLTDNDPHSQPVRTFSGSGQAAPTLGPKNGIDLVGANGIVNSDDSQNSMAESPTNWLWGSLQQMDTMPQDYDWEFLTGLAAGPGNDTQGPIISSSDYSLLPKVFGATAVGASESAGNDTEDDAEDDIIASLSARLGTLKVAPDGQLRYYGATSNFNLLKVSLDATQGPEIRSIRKHGQEVLDRAKVGASINQELEDHVINLYFAWQDPSYHVVDRQMFEDARNSWFNGADNSPYYSEVLKNAMWGLELRGILMTSY